MKYENTNNSYTLDDVYKMCAEEVNFAIYGFGDTGKLLYSRAHQKGWFDRLVAIFDKNFGLLHDKKVNISKPDDVKNFDFQKIIVTNFAAEEEIGKFLEEQQGVDDDMVVFLEMNELQAGVWKEHDQQWLDGAKEEVHFWETKIGARQHFPNRCVSRASSEKSFNEELLGSFLGREKLAVLDVGSGPVTTLGYHHPEINIDLTMVDPLADNYAVLYDKYDFHPPVTPRRCAGEE
ncbi:MAG: hypothetical protein GJ680_20045 [Alteromonadaceae bacterium]|nr:hypothetical protein [Alteromonadaceae bacterium]